MKRVCLFALSVAMWLGTISTAWAAAEPPDGRKPLVVVSLASYDETKADVGYLGLLAGNPDLPKALDGLVTLLTAGRGIEGIDTSRNFGAVIYTGGDKPLGYAFVPVTDVKKLRESLAPHIRDVTEVKDGIHKVQGRHRAEPIFVKEQKGWLFVADNKTALGWTTEDPLAQLDGLNKQYDSALRIFPGNVPQEKREKLLQQLREHFERRLERRSGEDEQVHVMRKAIAKRLFQRVRAALTDLEQVTVGWQLDREAQQAHLDIILAAREDSGFAKRIAQSKEAKSQFAGFSMDGAAVKGLWVGDCPPRDQENLNRFFDALRTEVDQQIDKMPSDERAKTAKQFVGGMLDVARETIAAGHVDGGFSLLMKPSAVTLVSGKFVANPKKLEETLGQAVAAIRKEHPDVVSRMLKENAEQHKGVRMHVLSLPVPERAPNREKIVKAVGDQLDIVLGIGEKAVYLAAGRDSMATLKQAIDASVDSRKAALPLSITVTLSEFARFAAAMGNEHQRAEARDAIAAMEKAEGKDHIRLTAKPSNHSVCIRLEFEEGALRAMAAGGGMHTHKR